MKYKHIVEVMLDDLPAFVHEYPRTVQLFREYYENDANGLIDALWGYYDNIDIDKNGLERQGENFNFKISKLREFFACSSTYLKSKGTPYGASAYGYLFHNAPLTIDPTYKYVLEPSSAITQRYKRCFAISDKRLNGVLFQDGLGADIVSSEAVKPNLYEILYHPRHPGWLKEGEAVLGENMIEIKEEQGLEGANGSNFKIGDRVKVVDMLGEVEGEVISTFPSYAHEVMIIDGGEGFKEGDIICAKNSLASLVVRKIGTKGEILALGVFEEGKIDGEAEWQYIAAKRPPILSIPWGRPYKTKFPRPLVGIISYPPNFKIVTNNNTRNFVELPNGIIGIGSVLTDSALYRSGSYIAKANKSILDWGSGFLTTHHTAGRCVELRERVERSYISKLNIQTLKIRFFEDFKGNLNCGEGIEGAI